MAAHAVTQLGIVRRQLIRTPSFARKLTKTFPVFGPCPSFVNFRPFRGSKSENRRLRWPLAYSGSGSIRMFVSPAAFFSLYFFSHV